MVGFKDAFGHSVSQGPADSTLIGVLSCWLAAWFVFFTFPWLYVFKLSQAYCLAFPRNGFHTYPTHPRAPWRGQTASGSRHRGRPCIWALGCSGLIGFQLFLYIWHSKKKNHLKKVLLLSIRKRITVLKNFCGSCFLWQESGAHWTPRCPQEQRSLQTNTFFPVRNNSQKFSVFLTLWTSPKAGQGTEGSITRQELPYSLILFF